MNIFPDIDSLLAFVGLCRLSRYNAEVSEHTQEQQLRHDTTIDMMDEIDTAIAALSLACRDLTGSTGPDRDALAEDYVRRVLADGELDAAVPFSVLDLSSIGRPRLFSGPAIPIQTTHGGV